MFFVHPFNKNLLSAYSAWRSSGIIIEFSSDMTIVPTIW